MHVQNHERVQKFWFYPFRIKAHAPGGVHAHHGLFSARAFETLATFQSRKKPLDSALVHSSKLKDQSLAFGDKHCHPVYKITFSILPPGKPVSFVSFYYGKYYDTGFEY